jgi:hypothetical protein
MLLDRVYFFKKIFLSTFSNRMWFEYVSDSLRVASYSLTYGWDTFYYIKTFWKIASGIISNSTIHAPQLSRI